MTDEIAQRLAELQAQAAGLRVAVSVLSALVVLLVVAVLAIWSYQRRIYRLQMSQAHHVEAMGEAARRQNDRHRARRFRREARAAHAAVSSAARH